MDLLKHDFIAGGGTAGAEMVDYVTKGELMKGARSKKEKNEKKEKKRRSRKGLEGDHNSPLPDGDGEERRMLIFRGGAQGEIPSYGATDFLGGDFGGEGVRM